MTEITIIGKHINCDSSNNINLFLQFLWYLYMNAMMCLLQCHIYCFLLTKDNNEREFWLCLFEKSINNYSGKYINILRRLKNDH